MENLADRQKSWNKTLNILKAELSAQNFKFWFGKARLGEESEDKLIIEVPSTYTKEQINTKLRGVLEKAIEEGFNQKIPYQLKVNQSLEGNKGDNVLELSSTYLPQNTQISGLNSKYTLENFVVGLSNNLAYAAAQAVTQNPGTTYNPLFIYGGTGVGKTHLMHGVGNVIVKKNPALKVIYCSSEKFMNDFVQSIQTKKTGEFRAKYRNCDLFLIDDIQFISGRDSTQEEFFHTFNELQGKNCQIVLTSDRPPNEIEKLEGRLASRFQGGLMVDIQSPDFDTRVAILKAKCQERGDLLPEECLTLIAENMPTNARELEGKLLQIIQTSKLMHQPLTVESIRNFLGQPQPSNKQIDQKKVIPTINQYFNIKMTEILGPSRKKGFVIPRQIAMYLLYEECKIPYERIGQILGGRDHTTILHGVDKMRNEVNNDREIQKMLLEIKQVLASN